MYQSSDAMVIKENDSLDAKTKEEPKPVEESKSSLANSL